ncbi:MAG: hypothetical protein ACLGG0_01690 [Bacteriovoracia bacterium]|jgi:hypothetical protein
MALFIRFFVCCSFIALGAAFSVWNYPHTPARGLASHNDHFAPPKFKYDPSYKL